MQLRFDPFQIFMSSKTPAGLYARKQWLDEGNMQSWQVDFRATVDALLAGQSEDVSWGQSIVTTIQRLFGLHFTIRSQDEHINKALDWLMGKACTQSNPGRYKRALQPLCSIRSNTICWRKKVKQGIPS